LTAGAARARAPDASRTVVLLAPAAVALQQLPELLDVRLLR
jgi:hypothetical protein